MRLPDLGCTAQFIAWHARHAPEAAAVVEDGTPISYRIMAADVVRCVRAVEALGVRPDMLVGVETPGRYLHLLLLLACEAIGAASTSLLPGQRDEITRHCDLILANGVSGSEGQPKEVAVPSDWLATLAASPVLPEDLITLERDVVPNRMARLVTTSGTSGARKRIALSFGTLRLRIASASDRLPPEMPPGPCLLCLYHVAVWGIYMRVMSTLQRGGTVLFAAGEHASALIASGTVDFTVIAVGDLERMIQHATPPPTPPPFGHPLHIVTFGTLVTPRLRQQIRARLHASVETGYASNETNRITVVDDNNVGTLCAGVEVRIVDASGRDVPPGEAGIIRVRTDAMVHGYFNDQAMTEASFIDGWFQTGDMGFMPEPGKLVVLGRADDMLNIGGVKLAPSPIEAEMKLADGVNDAVLMSIASENGVGILLAAIEIRGDRLMEHTAQQIGAVLSRHIGAFVIMPSRGFPRTASGKIIRHEIEAEYRQRPAHELIAVS